MRILIIGTIPISGMAVIRALKKEGYTFVGTDYREIPFNIHSRYTKPYYKHSSFSDERFYGDILMIIKKEKLDVVLSVIMMLACFIFIFLIMCGRS